MPSPILFPLLAMFSLSAVHSLEPAEATAPKMNTAFESIAPICKSHSELAICRLRETLDEALAEMDFILQHFVAKSDNEVENAVNLEKRKSAFVRFGKRSAESDANPLEMEMQKRKSAFVRFGRSDGGVQKRKSSYVRFG